MKGGDVVEKLRRHFSDAASRPGARGHMRGLLSALAPTALAVASVLVLASTAAAVSIRPDLIERLRHEGRLSEYVETQMPLERDAAQRGLNAPSRPPWSCSCSGS